MYVVAKIKKWRQLQRQWARILRIRGGIAQMTIESTLRGIDSSEAVSFRNPPAPDQVCPFTALQFEQRR
jgi:predicted ATPase with chaperone activity